MKNNNKNGFTLMELIAVLVILILLFLFAVTRVRKSIDSSQKKSVTASTLSFVKTVRGFIETNNNESVNAKYEGLFTVSQLYDLGVKLDGKKPEDGYVYVYNNDVVNACLYFGEYKVNILSGKQKDPIEGTCTALSEGYNKVIKTYIFKATKNEENVTLDKEGKYLIEAWGAQGGSANKDYIGGYGGYSKAILTLGDGESLKLYINVGTKGASNCNKTSCSGGYNGGTDSGSGTDAAPYYGAGGGATSIALSSGLLNTLSSSKDKVVMVAAGGGGASYINNSLGNNGGNAGGYVGNNSLSNSASKLYFGTGGTQTEGGSSSFTNSINGTFGKGGEFSSAIDNVASAGAGGGYYGGGYAGGGGSSYIAKSIINPSSNNEVLLSDRMMYCYNCYESHNVLTRTKKTNRVNSNAYSNNAKIGDGEVRITYLGK